MLPVIIGVGVIGYGLYKLLDSSKSEVKKAHKRYNNTYNYYNNEIKKSEEFAENKKELHILKKARKLSIEQANIIYNQLQEERGRYKKINNLIRESQIALNQAFEEKKSANRYSIRKEKQENIEMIITLRKELFSHRDEIKSALNTIQTQLKMANQKTSSLKEKINNLKYQLWY
jgi:homoserine dehydrogenase